MAAAVSLNEDGAQLRKRLTTQGSGSDHTQTQAVPAHEQPGKPAGEEVVWGKTPSGQGRSNGSCVIFRGIANDVLAITVFRVPTTHDVLTSLFHPLRPKSHMDILNLALLGLQLIIFSACPTWFTRPFFFVYFAFWRAAYDAGLGWVLTKQSKRKWIVKEVQKRGWFDEEKRPNMRAWIKRELSMKMGDDYSFDVSDAAPFPNHVRL